MHRDAGSDLEAASPSMYNVFVALQDISCEMGPTVLLPRTQSGAALAADAALYNAEARARCAAERARTAPHDERAVDAAEAAVRSYMATNCAPLLRTGDALVYDTRLRHCGSANASSTPRRILTFAFAAEGAAVRVDDEREETNEHDGRARVLAELCGGECSLDEAVDEWPARAECLVQRDTYSCRS